MEAQGKARQARAWHGRAGAPPSASASQLFGSRLALTSAEPVQDDEMNPGVRVAAFLATRNEVRHVVATAPLAPPPPTTSGVPKPEGFGPVSEKPVVVQHSHRAEIQHLAFIHTSGEEGLLGSTDGRGAAVVSRFSLSALASHTGEAMHLPPASPLVEWGWSGLAFNPSSGPTALVRVNYFGKSLEWFEEDRCVRQVHTLGCPTQASFVRGQPNLVAVTEGNDLALWDLRSSEKNGCTKRITVAGGPLHGLAIGEGKNAGAIAVGGAGRSVTLVDTRKWTPRNRATNLTKYEISSVHLSGVAEDVCYAGGVDSEVVCRNVGAKVVQKKENPEKIYGGGHYDGFRGDGRWVGLQCTTLPATPASSSSSSAASSSSSVVSGGEEVLVGHTELGSLYMLLRPNVLATLS